MVVQYATTGPGISSVRSRIYKPYSSMKGQCLIVISGQWQGIRSAIKLYVGKYFITWVLGYMKNVFNDHNTLSAYLHRFCNMQSNGL